MFTVACPRITCTVTAGEGWVTLPIAQSILYHLFVKAPESSTVFDVEIENGFEDIVYSHVDIDGELNEELRLPFDRRVTLYVRNATADGTFIVIPSMQDG